MLKKIVLSTCLLGLAGATQAGIDARVNVGHLAPFSDQIATTAVSVNLRGSEVLANVVFNEFSDYLSVTDGSALVEIFNPPGQAPAAISGTFDLNPGVDYTVVATGNITNQDLDLLALVDDNTPPTPGSAKIRVAHTAPFASDLADTAVSIRLDSGAVVNGLNNVQFGQDSGFFELTAGTYDLQVASPNGSQAFINLAPVTLNDGDIVTIFAVGDGANQPLGATAFFSNGTSVRLPLETTARVNVAHLAPFAGGGAEAVSVEIGGIERLNPVFFNEASGYIPLDTGTTQVDVFNPPGAMMADITGSFDLLADTDYTVAAIGNVTNQPLALLPLVDDNTAPAAGNFKIRVAHTAPFATALGDTAVSIRQDDGTVVNSLSSVQYGQDSGFFELPAGTYDLKVASPDGSQTFINLAPVSLGEGDIVTIFAVGDGTNQPLGASAFFADGTFASLDLEPNARVNVAHLAPFADALADTAVSVDVNSTEILTGVQFNQASGYLPLDGGNTTVDVFAPPGAMMAAITATVDLMDNMEFTVAAIGDGSNQPLALLPLVDDNSAPTAGNAKIRIAHTAPFAADLADTAVSIRTDGGTVVNGLASVEYGQDSGFFELPAGTYDLQVAAPDGSVAFINLAPITLQDGDIVTVFAVGDGANQPLGASAFFSTGNFVSLQLEPELVFASGFESAQVNVAHLAPFAADIMSTGVNVEINGATALTGVVYQGVSGYVPLSPIETTVSIIGAPVMPGDVISSLPVLASDTVSLEADVFYTAAAIGDGTNQTPALLFLVDDNTDPAAGNIKIRVVHSAPFDADLASTAVSIRLDDGTIVNNLASVQYGQDSGFFELPAGVYDLQVASPDGTQAFIDLAPLDLAAGTIVTVFAVGDGANQPLGATAVFGDGSSAELTLE